MNRAEGRKTAYEFSPPKSEGGGTEEGMKGCCISISDLPLSSEFEKIKMKEGRFKKNAPILNWHWVQAREA